MSAAARFDFLENVVVETPPSSQPELCGRVGTVLGRAEAEDGSSWWYAVSIDGRTWSVAEAALRSMGTFAEREAFYDGTTLRVSSTGELL